MAQVSSNLDFWSDASDVGWGAHLGQEVVSGRRSPEEASLSINARELLSMERGLLHFQSQVSGFHRGGACGQFHRGGLSQEVRGTRSATLNSITQRIRQ